MNDRRVPPWGKGGARTRFRLHLGRTDGTGPTRPVTPECAEAAWSPDGGRLVCAARDDRAAYAHPDPARMTRIYIVGIDGTSEQMIFERLGAWTPQDWSPDGRRLLLRPSSSWPAG